MISCIHANLIVLVVCITLSSISSYTLGFYGAKFRAQRWLDRAIKNGTLTIQRR